jgi:hypothetical protein
VPSNLPVSRGLAVSEGAHQPGNPSAPASRHAGCDRPHRKFRILSIPGFRSESSHGRRRLLDDERATRMLSKCTICRNTLGRNDPRICYWSFYSEDRPELHRLKLMCPYEIFCRVHEAVIDSGLICFSLHISSWLFRSVQPGTPHHDCNARS